MYKLSLWDILIDEKVNSQVRLFGFSIYLQSNSVFETFSFIFENSHKQQSE